MLKAGHVSFFSFRPGGTAFSLNQIYHTVSLVWVCLRTCYTVIAAADVNKCSKLALPYLYECHTQYYNIEVILYYKYKYTLLYVH